MRTSISFKGKEGIKDAFIYKGLRDQGPTLGLSKKSSSGAWAIPNRRLPSLSFTKPHILERGASPLDTGFFFPQTSYRINGVKNLYGFRMPLTFYKEVGTEEKRLRGAWEILEGAEPDGLGWSSGYAMEKERFMDTVGSDDGSLFDLVDPGSLHLNKKNQRPEPTFLGMGTLHDLENEEESGEGSSSDDEKDEVEGGDESSEQAKEGLFLKSLVGLSKEPTELKVATTILRETPEASSFSKIPQDNRPEWAIGPLKEKVGKLSPENQINTLRPLKDTSRRGPKVLRGREGLFTEGLKAAKRTPKTPSLTGGPKPVVSELQPRDQTWSDELRPSQRYPLEDDEEWEEGEEGTTDESGDDSYEADKSNFGLEDVIPLSDKVKVEGVSADPRRNWRSALYTKEEEKPKKILISQTRYRPGLSRAWRLLRAQFCLAWGLKWERQRRLTNFVSQLKGITGLNFIQACQGSAGGILRASGLVGDQPYIVESFFVNSREAPSPLFQVYKGDKITALRPPVRRGSRFQEWGKFYNVKPSDTWEVDGLTRGLTILDDIKNRDYEKLIPTSDAIIPFLTVRMYNWKYRH